MDKAANKCERAKSTKQPQEMRYQKGNIPDSFYSLAMLRLSENFQLFLFFRSQKNDKSMSTMKIYA